MTTTAREFTCARCTRTEWQEGDDPAFGSETTFETQREMGRDACPLCDACLESLRLDNEGFNE